MNGRNARPARTFVIMASTPFHGHRLYEQRLAAALGKSHAVLYVEPPAYPFRRGRGAPPPAGVTVVRPWTIPYGRRRGLAVVTGAVAAAWVWALLLGRGRPEATVIATSMHPVTRRFLSRLPTIALVKDDYVAGADLLGADAARLARRRTLSLRLADTVVVVSPVLRDTVALAADVQARVIPAGCELPPAGEVAPEPPELQGVPHPRAVFIGLISDRIDFDYFTALGVAGYHLVTVGGVQPTFSRHGELDRLGAAGRLTQVPGSSAERVRAFLDHSDLGLVPYTLSDFNRASFPLKTLEYLAAGLPVVGSELDSLQWLDAPHVMTGAATQVGRLLAELGSHDPALVADRCRDFAARNTWAERAEEFVALADGLASGRNR